MYKPFTKRQTKILLLSLNTLKMHLDTFSTLEEQCQAPSIINATIDFLTIGTNDNAKALIGISLASVYAHNALLGLEKIDDESLAKMKPFKSEYDSLYKKYSHILKLNL